MHKRNSLLICFWLSKGPLRQRNKSATRTQSRPVAASPCVGRAI